MHRADQMNFAAVDFETANQSRASVCQAGVAIVRNGVVEDVQEWLVQPPTGMDNFNPRNVQIHRITPRMAANGILWEESAERLTDFVGDLPVIAHNAPFDRSVYLAACETLALRPSEWKWYCSLEISQDYLPLPHHSLDQVAAHLGIDNQDPHKAGSDAHTAAEVLLAISRNSGTNRLQDLGWELPAPNRRGRRTGGSAAASFIPAHTISRYVRVSDLPRPNPSADPEHPLHGEHIVLSGKIGDHDRDHWIERLAEVGAHPQLNITKKTALVVIGADAGKSKASDAEERSASGQRIQTIPGDRLITLLDQVHAAEIDDHLHEEGEAGEQTDAPTESHSRHTKTVESARSEPHWAEYPDPIQDIPSPSQSEAATSVEARAADTTAWARDHDAVNFQRWSGPPGSLPIGWTLTMEHRGRERHVSTATVNRNPTGLLKRLGAFGGIVIGSFILAAILTPILGAAVPVVFLGGIVYGIVFLVKSARADKLRWQYWAGTPEQRKVLYASTRAASSRKKYPR